MALKKNVEVFGADAKTKGGYVYTTVDKLSTRFSNDRTTQALYEIIDFEGKSVLDIGCGDGFFTASLVAQGPSRIVGVDPSESAIEVARRRGLHGVDFRVADLYEMTPHDFGTFDVAVMRGVIHHVSDAQKACSHVCKLAKEIVGMEPNGANIILKVIEKTSAYHIAHEERSYLPATLDRYFEGGGAIKIRGDMINLVPIFSPDWLARACKAVEPLVESLPLIRYAACGQYVFRYRTPLADTCL